MALSIVDISLRTTNFVFLVIVLGLTCSLRATQRNTNPQVNYCIFAAVWGLVFGFFYNLLAAFISVLAWPAILAVLDFMSVVFSFAGATALAAAIRTHSCHNRHYLDNNAVTQGSTDRCRKAQASVAFLYFSFFVFLVNLVFSVIAFMRNGAFGVPSRSSARAPKVGVPNMTQV